MDVKLNIGILDTKPRTEEITAYYKIGDRLIILPEWDGRIMVKDEYIRYHENGEIGEVMALGRPKILISRNGSKNGILHYDELTIVTATGRKLICHPSCYLLGYKLVLSINN